jgi:hypothetical protein
MGLLKKWDTELPFPLEKHSGAYIKDGIFNWILKRYKKFNHPWKRSDEIVWKTVIYFFGDLLGIALFFWIMWVLINYSLKKYGEWKTLYYVIIIGVFRINILIMQISSLNKKF